MNFWRYGIFSVVVLNLQLQCCWASFLEIIEDDTAKNFAAYRTEVVVRNGTCDNQKTRAEILVNSTTPNTHILTVCHDEVLDVTLWSQHYLYGHRPGEQTCKTNQFRNTDFYKTIDVDHCYKRVTQNETIELLLRDPSHQYHDYSKELFLSRGHLAPNCDPITTDEKNSTYNYINAHPQWQSINNGNWKRLETNLMKMAIDTNSTFKIWTGTFGNLALPDINGNDVQIFLGRIGSALTNKLPVNKYTWKVVHDLKTNKGVAVIMINNPWVKNPSADKFCTDVCNQLTRWVDWNVTNPVRGYTFCCTVSDFKQQVSWAPNLGNLQLLT